MSIISIPNPPVTGQVITAAATLANLTTIYNDYNGNITNANLSSSIAITDNHLNQITTASKVSGTAITGLASLPSGAGIIPAANLVYSNISYPYVKVSETQTSGTGAGTPIATTWTNRVLNTKDNDTASIATLSGNQVTLPAGTYQCNITTPFYNNGANVVAIRLFNATASSVILLGQSGSSQNDNNVLLPIRGQFTLSGTSALAVQYNTPGTATNGLGFPTSIQTEVYTIAEFTKLS